MDGFDIDLRLGELGDPHRHGRQPASPVAVAAQNTAFACDTSDTCDGPTWTAPVILEAVDLGKDLRHGEEEQVPG